jgi:hypothetical protein
MGGKAERLSVLTRDPRPAASLAAGRFDVTI